MTKLGGNFAISVMNADGSKPINLTSSSETLAMPAWSPDGAHIAFGSTSDGRNEIYVMNANGGYPTRLTNHPAGSGNPAWSPDGTRIAFGSPRNGNWEIYVMNPDGSQVTQLTNDLANDETPAWSPDGKRIAFAASRDGNPEIYVMNADGSQPVRLTNTSMDQWQYYPKWSPDGKRIAFASNRDGNWEIYVMNADGSQQTRLTHTAAVDSCPAWSADGTQIYFYSNRDGNSQIYAMKPDGSQQVRISSNDASELAPDWQPREASAEAFMTPPSSVNALATLWLPTPTVRPAAAAVAPTVTVKATVSSAATPTSTMAAVATAGLADAVYIKPTCNCQAEVPVGKTGYLRFAWSATKPELTQGFVAASQFTVTIDGKAYSGLEKYWGAPSYSPENAGYKSSWDYPLPPLTPGTHHVETRISLSRKVNDGQGDYGPGDIFQGWVDVQIAGTSSAAPSATATVAPPTATATSAPPGLYVTAMGKDQAQPAHGQVVNFTVSFLNTSSGDLNVKWKVYIYRADTPNRSNTESAAVPQTFNPGQTLDQRVPMNFLILTDSVVSDSRQRLG